MLIGKVTGSVVATRKDEKLVGSKLLIIEPLRSIGAENLEKLVAVDNIGAGIGDIVLVSTGSAARLACPVNNAPCDAAVVGIVDSAQGLEL